MTNQLTADELMAVSRQVARETYAGLSARDRRRTDFDELFSEAYIAAATAAEKIGPHIDDQFAYVATAARNGLRRWRRSEARNEAKRDAGAILEELPARQLEDPLDTDWRGLVKRHPDFDRIVRDLPGDLVRLIELRFVEDRTFAYIAQTVGLSETGVRKRLRQAVSACQVSA